MAWGTRILISTHVGSIMNDRGARTGSRSSGAGPPTPDARQVPGVRHNADHASGRGDLAPSLSYEVRAKAKVIYREDYLLYERLRRMDVGAGAGIIAIAASSARRSET